MCIGVPGQIRTIDGNQAKVDVCGIQRDVDLTLVGSCDEHGKPRLDQWVHRHRLCLGNRQRLCRLDRQRLRRLEIGRAHV